MLEELIATEVKIGEGMEHLRNMPIQLPL